MKVSWNWLKQYVDLEGLSPNEVADKLTFAGVEVESVTPLASATGLTTGKIISCVPHPDSDHLHVLQVDEGKNGIHQIVCGAPNARTGLTVIVAKEGAVLPLVTIKKSTIRGVDSDGMCCALYELGVDKKYLTEYQCNGIEELPLDTPTGLDDVLSYLHLDDVVLDLDLLANRSDLNSILNVAKEVSTLFKRKLSLPTIPSFNSEKDEEFVVGSETPSCLEFFARTVHGVKVGPSPRWLSDILRSEGIRSINNVVDAGNYIMLLTGEPLNMYDEDALPKKELIVKDNYEGDFLAMDEKHYSLIKGDTLVTSGNENVCLAGIMTSSEAAVKEGTKNIVIEAAYFVGAPIRHTSLRLGLASESSSRFIKGINPEGMEEVLSLAAKLLIDIAGAKEVYKVKKYDVYPHKDNLISTSLSYINNRLGTSFTLDTVISTLKDDHMEVKKIEGENFTLKVPSYRIDMGGEADVSEEVIRILGYENVKERLPKMEEQSHGYSDEQKKKIALRNYLRHQGVNEAITYTLTDKEKAASFNYLYKGEPYVLLNPLSEDRKIVRRSLIPSLIDVVSYNYARQSRDFAFFEMSDIDDKEQAGCLLSVVGIGNENDQEGLNPSPYDYYRMKGFLTSILEILGIHENRYSFRPLVPEKNEFHPYRSAEVTVGKKVIAILGEIHPLLQKKLGFNEKVSALEIDLAAVLSLGQGQAKAIVPPKFPSVKRDLAFIISKDADYLPIKKLIERQDHLIKDVSIFDEYTGEGVEEGKKSLALSIVFRSDDETLKEETVNGVMEKIIASLNKEFGAEVRR